MGANLLGLLWGTMRVLVDNMVVGVSRGFEKKLQLNGVGYRAKVSGQDDQSDAGLFASGCLCIAGRASRRDA